MLHAFTDGRDTLPTSGAGYLETVEGWMDDAGAGRIGSVVGRYWAMDRDKRWDRIQRAYDLLVHGRRRAPRREPVSEAAREAYERDETDEFITPVLVGEEARIRPGDSVFAFNFRPDRMREITRALADPEFSEIDRGGARAGRALRDDDRVRGGLALPGRVPARATRTSRCRAVLAERGVRQLHVAETEKYAARHLLLQRRRGEAVRGRAPRAGRLRRATCPPTTTSPR